MTYFSDRETGVTPPTNSEISFTVWRGIEALIDTRIKDGSFGASFPECCSPGIIYGTDEETFWAAVFGVIPELDVSRKPGTFGILDLIEFCWCKIGKPDTDGGFSHLGHFHLHFDTELGRMEFRDEVNMIFRRNKLIYELTDEGKVQRIIPAEFQEALSQTTFKTGDVELGPVDIYGNDAVI